MKRKRCLNLLRLHSIQKSHQYNSVQKQEILKLKKELYEIIALHSTQPFKKIEKDADRDYWMTSGEAKEYGMIDEILQRT